MRIGTWNLAGRWSPAHAALLDTQDCDVWLLTEVSARLDLPGYTRHLTRDLMATERHWAGILARRPMQAVEQDPHRAAAAAVVDDTTFVSSILPWRASGQPELWGGTTHASKMRATLSHLESCLRNRRLVWGGDWNQALQGPEYAGSNAGREALHQTLRRLDLVALTRTLPHCLGGLSSIDHIAVPTGWAVTGSERVEARTGDRRLSDHDMYVVAVTPG